MAEVVGLVLGVAGLAGRIGALKEVVGLFGLREPRQGFRGLKYQV